MKMRFWGLFRHLALSAALIAGVLVGLPGERAYGELRIDISRGRVEPLPLAVINFAGAGEAAKYGRDLAQVIAANLVRSGLFRPINQAAFIQRELPVDVLPRFGDWRVINAQALVNGSVTVAPDGRLRVEFRLWDVYAEAQLEGQSVATVPGNWRRLAHVISDMIYQRLTGESGYFDTRLVYIAETGPATRRVKRLAIMDQDGANHKFLTDGSTLVLTPRFSPTTQEITYLAYYNRRPRVYIFNIDTGQQEVLGDFPGMTFAPRFSPDGNKVIMSLSRNGITDIYTMDLRTRAVSRLTNSPSIDTSPTYAPDGRQIVFNSDRGGSQQLYVMSSDGDNVRRISFGRGRYATPVWSPRGDLIAFTKIVGGQFHIGVMKPDGSGERLLTSGFLVEAPTWAPNGRVLIYFKQIPGGQRGGGATRLFSIDLTGFTEREILTPVDASDPAWSPLIP